jgi:hypothetical protein
VLCRSRPKNLARGGRPRRWRSTTCVRRSRNATTRPARRLASFGLRATESRSSRVVGGSVCRTSVGRERSCPALPADARGDDGRGRLRWRAPETDGGAISKAARLVDAGAAVRWRVAESMGHKPAPSVIGVGAYLTVGRSRSEPTFTRVHSVGASDREPGAASPAVDPRR